ncbi:hypothetical protein ACLD0W_08710 [Alloalcanivorax sp. C16-1]|uniref:hypothetical protein n=1 Tax=Alloalcanivorax sp. C16-1 TaxID=3390051 RepID=UPI003970D457
MKTQILKSSMLALAGAVAIAAAGSASAMSPPYAMCNYKGESTLTFGGSQSTCWLTLATKVNCAGDVEIVAAGPVAGDATCPFLFVGNFPWTGNAAAIIAGGATINTDANGLGITSVNDAAGSPLAGGLLNGVGGSTSTAVACDTGSTVNVPDQVPVSGTFSYTGAAFNAAGLDNKGCTLVP